MSQRKIEFVNEEIYHVITRAIDGLTLFKNKSDFLRMVHDLFEFNDDNLVPSRYRMAYQRSNVTRNGGVTLYEKKRRKLLVEILCFCLMPNHVHLLLRQMVDDGISRFMQKFGGYSSYFNLKYKRKGHLFQDRFRAVHIQDDRQLLTAFVYIHTNPIAIIYPGWKERGIENIQRAMDYLEQYRWSSFPDYLGVHNFPSVTSRTFLRDFVGGTIAGRDAIRDWFSHKKELFDLENVALE